MKQHILLTPGPLSTSLTVKKSMMIDLGTRDHEYSTIVQDTRMRLLELANADKSKYSVVFMQGSGTFGVESVITSWVSSKDKLLILANGAYGERIAQICEQAKIAYQLVEFDMLKSLPIEKIESYMDKDISHVACIHMETTVGVLNDIEAIAKLTHKHHKYFMVDAMSSFGGIPIDLNALDIDFLVSSSNKCLQGVPGLGIIFGKHSAYKDCRGISKSLSLDLYAQYQDMEEKEGSFRFTSPTHVMVALHQSIIELFNEGGIFARSKRYDRHQKMIQTFMIENGFETIVSSEDQSNIITTFMIPKNLNFDHFYDHLKMKGFLLYSGKLPGIQAFRIGNIGNLHDEDLKRLFSEIKEYLKEYPL